jgi:RNA polymerase sigma factor (TIGR02999 family)
MRQILSNHARARNAGKRGSGDRPVTFDEAVSGGVECGASFVALDDALNELAKFDERKSRLIEMKYFGGLTGEEIAEVLDTSRSTVVRETRIAEAWLQDYLNRR